MTVDWSYYDNKKFDKVNEKYLPQWGEGETMATQIVTAVNKLVYKWYNDGDVYDNTHYLEGWLNDLSSYANWLYENTDENIRDILEKVFEAHEGDYEDLLKELADALLDEDVLAEYNKRPAVGSIYHCDGAFHYEEPLDEEDEDDEEW